MLLSDMEITVELSRISCIERMYVQMCKIKSVFTKTFMRHFQLRICRTWFKYREPHDDVCKLLFATFLWQSKVTNILQKSCEIIWVTMCLLVSTIFITYCPGLSRFWSQIVYWWRVLIGLVGFWLSHTFGMLNSFQIGKYSPSNEHSSLKLFGLGTLRTMCVCVYVDTTYTHVPC